MKAQFGLPQREHSLLGGVCVPVGGGIQRAGTGVCVCGLPVTVNVEASVLLNEHCTVREW